ncbi:uncharacterized protein C18orf63 [Trichonephila clavata]|uniref:Uncharacterized protein C18orf63 n=1 Tax=Trichonephila clavata TaxID=2740835 RepID=A0A8X6EYR4_TRICU|nr:uncharacterized protein C18orf63 [Trichonephila clavata]
MPSERYVPTKTYNFCSDFLTTAGPLNTVKMDIFVSHREITLSLQPTCIKLPVMKTNQFINPDIDQFFHTNSVIKVEEDCYVLPSMKQGKIISISKNPKANGAFENYIQIQQHWKDMYGYVLPNEPKEGFWYYNVKFRIPNATPYTYPSV